jgi:hypothetical protein
VAYGFRPSPPLQYEPSQPVMRRHLCEHYISISL